MTDTPWQTGTDAAVLAELGARIERHRLDRDWTRDQLAEAAGVSPKTVQRLEGGASTQLANWLRVLRALDLLANLDALVPEPALRPLEQLDRGGARKRASGRARAPESGGPWRWGDQPGSEG